jgi:hypothetical protein
MVTCTGREEVMDCAVTCFASVKSADNFQCAAGGYREITADKLPPGWPDS